MRKSPGFFKAIVVVSFGIFASCLAQAQSYPSHPITIIVNADAGGPTDIVARALKDIMSSDLGQPIVIENRTGAGGIVGATAAARAQPNGYTLLISGAGPLVFSPLLSANVPYDPAAFKHIALLTTLPTILAVNPKIEAKTVAELIALAKRKPGELMFASSGIGTPSHLAGELFKQVGGIEIQHVPYRSVPQANLALATGEVALSFTSPSSSLPLIADGRIRALAVTGNEQFKQAPQIPSITQAGYRNMEVLGWFGLLAPANTPNEIVNRLYQSAAKALADSKVREVLSKTGGDPALQSPEEFSRYTKNERERWGKVVRAAGIKPE
ncbi:MAG: tripartite tricarboxylate transporter substrate binding protein [Polaromonas sp.]|uniref:Bug family tripartite tricarboxylate transporter substrate binding protein n=1 Tax=Polaromonas sp. TaxID=1869339 RepID=UPI0025F81D23|nr:tripartite tricarboxylate transporter substrate binding protein [Polaromonas sp.]MBI2726234.1 tripartite tricarboxylate transporter substrate binding protein [Polaromonas sp.]